MNAKGKTYKLNLHCKEEVLPPPVTSPTYVQEIEAEAMKIIELCIPDTNLLMRIQTPDSLWRICSHFLK